MTLNNGITNDDNDLIVSFDEILIDFVPTIYSISLAVTLDFHNALGGTPANVAITVSRLGGQVAFVGKLDNDELGHMLTRILKENGVHADNITFDQGARTTLAS